MQFDLGEIVTIACVTIISLAAILVLRGGGTEIVAAGLGGLVGYLTKSNNGGSNATGETTVRYISGDDNIAGTP
jgi:hypothetical protein